MYLLIHTMYGVHTIVITNWSRGKKVIISWMFQFSKDVNWSPLLNNWTSTCTIYLMLLVHTNSQHRAHIKQAHFSQVRLYITIVKYGNHYFVYTLVPIAKLEKTPFNRCSLNDKIKERSLLLWQMTSTTFVINDEEMSVVILKHDRLCWHLRLSWLYMFIYTRYSPQLYIII